MKIYWGRHNKTKKFISEFFNFKIPTMEYLVVFKIIYFKTKFDFIVWKVWFVKNYEILNLLRIMYYKIKLMKIKIILFTII